MFDPIIQYLKENSFRPGVLNLFFNPFYFARKGLYENISAMGKHINGKTLDIGCGQKPYEEVFNASQYIGLEIDSIENRENKKADKFYDGKNFPFNDHEFDSVVLFQVFEHVFNPFDFLSEINRVLKVGGILLMTVPFVWDEHEQPYDYARYSSFGLKSIIEQNGFSVIEQRKSMKDIRVVFQLANDYVCKKMVTRKGYIKLFIALMIIIISNISGELLSKVLPENDDLYIDNIILAKKQIDI